MWLMHFAVPPCHFQSIYTGVLTAVYEISLHALDFDRNYPSDPWTNIWCSSTTNASITRRIIILVQGILRLTYLNDCLVTGIVQSCSTPYSQLERKVTCLFSLRSLKDISSHVAATHSDCVMRTTFVRSPTNFFDVAELAGHSASTDPGRFLTIRFVLQQCETYVSGTSW